MKRLTQQQRRQQIDEMVAVFIKRGFSYSELERCLELKQGSLKTDVSYELLVLLKILVNFPWMIRVAEKDFDEIESKKALCHAAIDIMFQPSKKRI